MSLPTAITARWQPLRTGLVDLFYYDDQEFRFRDGRILFRGNNGTGKSKVLALTLPFLLDGELSPSRVEPDGDPAKRMEWNLLLGGRYEERTGYTWLEFGRVAGDGEQVFLTVGCGLKAVKGKGIADRWFFVTDRRVGDELFLIGPNGTVLTKDRLTEAIGTRGQVVTQASAYRRLLDERLFHLGVERYEALVSLLIQLRQPHLTKKPDEKKLSGALSQALAPMDQALIADVAAAFHDLEQQRDELAALRDTRDHVDRFLSRYQRYAAVAARRQSRGVRLAHSAYEHVNRDLSTVAESIARATREEHESAERLETAATLLAEQQAVREELAGDTRIKDLDTAERYADEADEAAAAAVAAVETAQATLAKRRGKHAEAVTEAGLAEQALLARTREAAPPAERAGLATAHGELLAALTDPAAEARARAALDTRGQAVAHVAKLAETATARERDVVAARTLLVQREGERDRAADRLERTRAEVAAACAAHVSAWRQYGLGLREIALPHPDDLDLSGWAQTLAGPHPAEAALREAGNRAARELAHAVAAATQRLEQRRAELDELAAERDRLAAGELARPRVPYTRGEGVRERQPGAPLWALVDFREEVGPRDRAGLEAALEASGLLDAWVTPDRRLLDPHAHDVIALPGEPVGASLSRVLVTGDDAARAVLDGIGWGEQPGTYVCSDGRWRLGPLHGAWAKPDAEYVGAATREEARLRRLAELATLIAAAEEQVDAARQAVAALTARQDTLAAELTDHPLDDQVRSAHAALGGAEERHADTCTAVEEQAEQVRWAEDDLAAARADRDRAADDLGLPADPGDLAQVREDLATYRQALTELVAAGRSHAARLAEVRTWAEELAIAEDALRRSEDGEREAARRAAQERARLDTLREAIGASVDELRERLAVTKTRINELTAEIKRLDGAHRNAVTARAKAEGRQEQLQTNLAEAVATREQAIDALRRFADTGLLEVACRMEQPGSWAPDPAVRLARRVEQSLSEVDDSDEAWRRVQDEITRRYSELSEALTRHGHHAVAGLSDWFTVTIQFQGKERPPGELTALLSAELDYRERTLTARQREIVEEHLVNDVAAHLQQLIADADVQVAEMNKELEERPTSTGMRLRMSWLPDKDAPAGLPEARARLLRQGAELWSPADRAAVADFLQAQIEAERAKDPHGTWAEHLRRALDYRAWHTFVIERYQDGRWRPATGPASGGERVLTVSLPLFAAASSHYRSAHPHAPRLVTLDEAFAGVDDDARAKCLGLLTTFDLDVAMTSEREWGFYATVPGIATHQLVRRDGIDAVHVTTWEWDGVRAETVERDASARAPREPAEDRPVASDPAKHQPEVREPEEDGLW